MILQTINVLSHLGIPKALFVSLFWPSHSLPHRGVFLLALPQQVFCSPEPPAKTSTPEDFIRMTKGITMATAKAVAAGNSCRQEDVIATANLSRRAIADMLRACKVEIPAVRQECKAA